MPLRTHTRTSTTRRTGLALQKKANSDSARADGINRKGEEVSDEEIANLAMKAGLIERLDLTRFDWLPSLREFAELVQSAERERSAKYLRDAAKGLPPYTAHVLACKGDELAAGYAWSDVGKGEKK